jgi:hypothetical protein
MLEREVAAAEEIHVRYKGHLLSIKIKISMQFDGKLIALLQGLGGPDAKLPLRRSTIPRGSSNDSIWIGILKNYQLREGITQEPIFKT